MLFKHFTTNTSIDRCRSHNSPKYYSLILLLQAFPLPPPCIPSTKSTYSPPSYSPYLPILYISPAVHTTHYNYSKHSASPFHHYSILPFTFTFPVLIVLPFSRLSSSYFKTDHLHVLSLSENCISIFPYFTTSSTYILKNKRTLHTFFLHRYSF